MTRPSVAVVGGGILGMTAAYRLAQAGVDVALYERAPDLGGLVGSFDFDGRPVDRFYHVILPTDDRVRGLAEELGLGDRFRQDDVVEAVDAVPVEVERADEAAKVVRALVERHARAPLRKAVRGREAEDPAADDADRRVGHAGSRSQPAAWRTISRQ